MNLPKTSKRNGLSKSRITAWRQCPKRLWLQTNRRDLATPDSDRTKRLYQVGNEVGEVAQRLHPSGILIEDQDNLTAAIANTKIALETYPDRPLFEAAFQHDGLLVRSDLLLPTSHGYRMIEVKSSASVKPYHVDDCAVQAWVLKRNNIKVSTVELAYIDSSFVYEGNGDYHGLFKSEKLDVDVHALLEDVPKWVSGARSTLEDNEPSIEPGEQCSHPFECQFKAHCYKDIDVPQPTEYPLSILHGMQAKKKAELTELGYVDALTVSAEYLNEKQLMIQHASMTGIMKFDQHDAKKEMAALPYPRYYIDFETVAPVIPLWAGTKPRSSQVPFQWSCHIEHASGQLKSDMFLDVSGDDPRRAFAESLINALGEDGPVLVYSKSFEQARIAELAEMFTDLSPALLAINERVVDLLPMARKYYYHPKMMGSWSIKAVLPTIAPDLAYDNLVVGDGGDAQGAYSEIIHPETSEVRRLELTEGLREYCALDTLAMVRLAWFFEGRCAEGGISGL